MIVLKSLREIALMREAGQLVAQALAEAQSLIEPGVSTRRIDAAIEAVFEERGAQPLFKGVPGKVPFPAVSCISVNEEVVHGIPGDRILQEGDLVSVDTGCRLAGWCGDSAWTFPVGTPDAVGRRLLDAGRAVLELAILEFGRKKHWSEVAGAMVEAARLTGFSLVEDYVGHGIGREMHEDPQVPNYVSRSLKQADFNLEAGLVLAIEPMVNAGGKATEVSSRDHWTVLTRRPPAERPFRAHGRPDGGGAAGADRSRLMRAGRRGRFSRPVGRFFEQIRPGFTCGPLHDLHIISRFLREPCRGPLGVSAETIRRTGGFQAAKILRTSGFPNGGDSHSGRYAINHERSSHESAFQRQADL